MTQAVAIYAGQIPIGIKEDGEWAYGQMAVDEAEMISVLKQDALEILGLGRRFEIRKQREANGAIQYAWIEGWLSFPEREVDKKNGRELFFQGITKGESYEGKFGGEDQEGKENAESSGGNGQLDEDDRAGIDSDGG